MSTQPEKQEVAQLRFTVHNLAELRGKLECFSDELPFENPVLCTLTVDCERGSRLRMQDGHDAQQLLNYPPPQLVRISEKDFTNTKPKCF